MSVFYMRMLIAVFQFSFFFTNASKYKVKVKRIESPSVRFAKRDIGNWEFYEFTRDSTYFSYIERKSELPDAPTMLLLHGLTFDACGFCNMVTLSKKFNIIAPNLPEDRVYSSMDEFSEYLVRFLKYKGIESCYITGISFGGVLAVKMASKYPKLIKYPLVTISSPIVGATEYDIKKNRIMANWVHKRKDWQLYRFMEVMLQNFKKKLNKNDFKAMDPYLRVKNINFYRSVTKSLAGYSAIKDYKKLDKLLLIQSDHDELFNSDAVLETLKKLNIDYETVRLSGGHALAFISGKEVSTEILNRINW